MPAKVSVVINVLNAADDIARAIKSVNWAGEIVVVDDGSKDQTPEVLEKLKSTNKKLKTYTHQGVGFVEPARNFAISKASYNWILILDADEVIQDALAKELVEIASKMNQIDYVRLPRKNIIFNHFMQQSMWWPDYNIRFFKKGRVSWTNKIHQPPEVSGQGLDLPAEEKNAIIHYNYKSISEFLERMNRYTAVQAEELKKEGHKFDWKDLLEKPLNEFLSRFFANKGYKDGLHGLALGLLQAFSFLVLYLKLWEMEKFQEQDIDLNQLEDQKNKSVKAIDYWIKQSAQQRNLFGRFFKKIKS